MRRHGLVSLPRLLPALLVVVACGGAKAPAVTPSGAGGASGVAGTSAGAAGATGTAGDVGTAGAAGEPETSDAGAAGAAGAPFASELPDGDAGGFDPPSDAGVDPDGGTVLPRYDGGIVNVLNATSWNETDIHPFSKRRMLLRDEGDPHVVLLDLGKTPAVVWRTVADGPWARGLQLIGNNQVLSGRHDGYEVLDLATGQIVRSVRTFPDTQSVFRMANGETVLTKNRGPSSATTAQITLSFLDTTDRISHAITYSGFGFVRMARPTRRGTFLVPSDTRVFEGDAAGNVLWSTTGAEWNHVWEPFLMSDGNVLLATFFGASLDVVNRDTHLVTKRIGTRSLPTAATLKPNGFADFESSPNGNFITTNWQGHGASNGNAGIHVIEFNPAGEVAWFYKQDATVFSDIQGVMVLDGMDPRFLHAMEISPDSTWQPVIPTP